MTAPASPDPQGCSTIGALLLELATAVDAQRIVATTNSLETPWVSPAADRARTQWSQADGRARTGADELRALADHVHRLAAGDESLPPPMTWPAQRPPGDPGPTAPDGVVIVMPEWTAALAEVWHAVATAITDGLSRARATPFAPALDAPDSALLERALGPHSSTALAAQDYRKAAEIAIAEATRAL